MEEAIGMQAMLRLSFQTNLNRVQDVSIDQGQHLVQQPLHNGDLPTCRLHFIPHPPLVDGLGRRVGRT
jgi:hypothetical protein